MRIFLSYAAEDHGVAESIHLALNAQGHDVFFDREDLPAGEEYDIRIREAIERAHLFVFLVSPDSLSADAYTRTELAVALKKWKHPAGRLLPVVIRPVEVERLPAAVRSVTLLEPEGNLPATVSVAVHHLTVAKRRAQLMRAGVTAAAAGVLAAAAYAFFTRSPPLRATGRDGAPAVLVPASTFTMGDGEQSPLREVFTDSFYMDRFEVTVSRYRAFLEATGQQTLPDPWPGEDAAADELPVVGVTWFDANAYCRWAGRRLPTETEWERAARGQDGRTYPWGNEEPTPDRATFLREAAGPYEGGLSPVGSHPQSRSPYGAEDLAGNAAEWVADWFDEGFARGDRRNPQGPPTGTAKVLRGGGWQEPAFRLQSARRMYAAPENQFEDTGFRCAADLRR